MRSGIDCKGNEWSERVLSGKMIDVSGNGFGRLVALFPVDSNHKKQWLCKCDCGNELVVTYNNLVSGNTKSCGCLHRETIKDGWKRYRDAQQYIGKKFGRLTVVEFIGVKESEAIYAFKCDCGNMITTSFHRVKQGNTKSCGCLKQDNVNMYKTDIIGQKFGHLLVKSYIGVNSHQNTVFECLCDCGESTTASRNSLITGHTQSCGCLRSVGENNIKHILNKTDFLYKQQYVFSDLTSELGGILPYDFAIIDDNNVVIRLIEFDGNQHNMPYEYFGGEEKFLKVKKNDTLKNKYAMSHDIPLVRVPYSKRDDMTIEDLLGDQYLVTKCI